MWPSHYPAPPQTMLWICQLGFPVDGLQLSMDFLSMNYLLMNFIVDELLVDILLVDWFDFCLHSCLQEQKFWNAKINVIQGGFFLMPPPPLKVLSVRLHEKCQIKLPVSPLGSASGTPLSKHLSAKANSSKYQNQCQWLQSLRSFRGTLVLSRAHIKMPALPWWPVPLQ